MKQQFLHEHHNRQEKASKPDYRKEMIERGRSEPSTATSRLIAKALAKREAELESELLAAIGEGRLSMAGMTGKVGKVEARICFKKDTIQQWRKRRFFHCGRVLKLGWPLEHFAKINVLPPVEQSTKQAFDALKGMAERDMEKISTAIMNGTVRYTRLSDCWTIPFVEWECSGVECDEIKK